MIKSDKLKFISEKDIKDIHDNILDKNLGLKGSRPDLSVSALVGRISSNLIYQSFSSIEEIAALYAEVIAKGHVFNDGNKRTALSCMVTFLNMNGYQLIVNQDILADKIVDLSENKITYREFAGWLKLKLEKHR